MGWEASSGFRGVSLIPLRSPSLASSELRNKQPSPAPQKPTLQEKAAGHACTQNFAVYVKCFILVYPGNSAGQGAKGEGPSLLGVHWALFVQRKVVLTKE